jgi:hypothetical protein
VNGGIIGSLLDCHSNWTAAHHFMKQRGADEIPPTVTSDFHVTLKRITPMDTTLHLRSRVVESSDDRAVIEATLDGERKDHGHVPRYVRGGEGRASGVFPVVR